METFPLIRFKMSVTKVATFIMEARDAGEALNKAMSMDLSEKFSDHWDCEEIQEPITQANKE